jgi:hypothetical protein
MGYWLSDFYRDPSNQGVPLSQAMSTFFQGTGGAPPNRSSYY